MSNRSYVIVLTVAALLVALAIAMHREGGMLMNWFAAMHGGRGR